MALRSTNEHEEKTNRTSRSFTMLYDDLTDELGLVTAAVLCAVVRYCQRREGVCRASLAELSRCLGVNKATVMRQLKVLVQQGYVIDATPHARFVPHSYYYTRKACEQEIQPVAQSNDTVAERNDSVAHNNTTGAESNDSVAQSQLKILDTIKDTGETRERALRAPRTPAAPELQLFRAAAEFNPPRQVTEDVIDAIRKVGQRLGREPTADDLRPFLKAWVSRGFRLNNLAWLFDWAVSGTIPERSERSERSEWKKGADGNSIFGVNPPPAKKPEPINVEEEVRLILFYNQSHWTAEGVPPEEQERRARFYGEQKAARAANG